MPNEDATPPPRVLIVMADQWRRAGLRAALRAEGYDAIGFPSLGSAVRVAPSAGDRGPVRVTVIDQDTLGHSPAPALDALPNDSELILVAGATVAQPPGRWRVVEEIVPLPASQRHAIDD
jgi:hypothetical protein